MLIGENWKIESDDLNVTLYQKKEIRGDGRGRATKKKVGEVYWIPLAYFSNPQNALDYIVKHEIMGTGLKEFEEVCAKIKELEELIRAFQPIDMSGRVL